MFLPPRHQDTKPPPRCLSRRSRGATKPDPQITQRDTEDFPKELTARRGPGRHPAARYRWVRKPQRKLVFGVVSLPSGLRDRAGLASFLPFPSIEDGAPDARQNRHAGGVPAGGKRGDSERWRLESPRFSPATDDQRSSVDLPTLMATPYKLANQAFASLRLCVLCGSTMCTRDACTTMVVQPSRLHSGRAFAMASVFPLCVSVPLWFSWCDSFVPLCLGGCGETVCDGSASICVICGRSSALASLCSLSASLCLCGFPDGRSEIPNSELRIPNSELRIPNSSCP